MNGPASAGDSGSQAARLTRFLGRNRPFISDRTVLDDVLELVQDQRHGEDRFVLVRTLWRYPDQPVASVLRGLMNDKDAPVARDAATALARIRKRSGKPMGERSGKAA